MAPVSGNVAPLANYVKSVTYRVVDVVVVFILLETPGAIVQIVAALQPFGPNLDVALEIAYFLSNGNSFINFFIYCATGRRFRTTLRSIFASGIQRRNEIICD
jgi:hypothetical protein